MDEAVWCMLLLLGIFVFIIYAALKDSSSDSEPARSTPVDKPPEPTKQKYVSIYEYTSLHSVKKCAHCDGENKYGAKVCCICGNDIDS